MHRIGNLIERTCSRENVELAVKEAKKRRGRHNALVEDMKRFMADYDQNVEKVCGIIRNGNWEIAGYRSFLRKEHGKVRKIDWNPSFRDNVIQHALFQTLGKSLNAALIPDTFSGIEGRGMHYGMKRVWNRLLKKYPKGVPCYIMKVDVHHYYESIDTDLLKAMLIEKVKDDAILHLVFILIDSHPNGLPIGNYLSQMLANFYLNEIDHWAVGLGIDYFRYCDDIVALSDDKAVLNQFMIDLGIKLHEIKLELKSNLQVFPIERTVGIDFMGFTINQNGVRLRKRIERDMRRSVDLFISSPCDHTRQSAMSYYGWTSWLTKGDSLWNSVLGELEAA